MRWLAKSHKREHYPRVAPIFMKFKSSLVIDLINNHGNSELDDIVQLVNHIYGKPDRWEACFGYHLTASFNELLTASNNLKSLNLDLTEDFVDLEYGILSKCYES